MGQTYDNALREEQRREEKRREEKSREEQSRVLNYCFVLLEKFNRVFRENGSMNL